MLALFNGMPAHCFHTVPCAATAVGFVRAMAHSTGLNLSVAVALNFPRLRQRSTWLVVHHGELRFPLPAVVCEWESNGMSRGGRDDAAVAEYAAAAARAEAVAQAGPQPLAPNNAAAEALKAKDREGIQRVKAIALAQRRAAAVALLQRGIVNPPRAALEEAMPLPPLKPQRTSLQEKCLEALTMRDSSEGTIGKEGREEGTGEGGSCCLELEVDDFESDYEDVSHRQALAVVLQEGEEDWEQQVSEDDAWVDGDCMGFTGVLPNHEGLWRE